jgi:hypothetical protein
MLWSVPKQTWLRTIRSSDNPITRYCLVRCQNKIAQDLARHKRFHLLLRKLLAYTPMIMMCKSAIKEGFFVSDLRTYRLAYMLRIVACSFSCYDLLVAWHLDTTNVGVTRTMASRFSSGAGL